MLTTDELWAAYMEQERTCIENDIRELLDDMLNDGEITESLHEYLTRYGGRGISTCFNLYNKFADCNVAYNDTLRNVVDEAIRRTEVEVE